MVKLEPLLRLLPAGVRGLAPSEVMAILPGASVLVVVLLWSRKDGGVLPTTWLPGALFLLGVLVVLVVAGAVAFGDRVLLASLILLGAFTLWNYASILWAQERGPAWDGSNRTLLYFCVFTIIAARRWSGRAAAAGLGVFASSVAAIFTIQLDRATAGNDPGAYFIVGRLATPIDYSNADACLAILAFWPAVLLASRRGVPILLRGLLLAAAGLLLEAAVLCQSRATLIAVPATALVFLLVVPQRLRAGLALVPVAVVVALAGSRLSGVYTALEGSGNIVPALSHARHALAVSMVGLFFVGTLWAIVDRAVVIPTRVVRSLGIAVVVVAVAACGTASALAVSRYGNPVDRSQEAWRHFKSDSPIASGRAHLLGGLGSKRYDLWRVAVLEFERHPIGGTGSDNFGAAYIRERRTATSRSIRTVSRCACFRKRASSARFFGGS